MKLKILLTILISLFAFSLVAAQSAPPAKGYMLRPGDELEGKVTLEPLFDFKATVNEDGMIEVPFSEKPVAAKCRTDGELKADLIGLLSKYLKSPQMGILVTKRNIVPVTLYGEVVQPREVELRRKGATLVELLALSGGVKEEAGGMVQIFRTQAPVCSDETDAGNWQANSSDPTDVPSRMYSLASVRLGKEEANPIIYPGDVIFVHKAAPVYVTGEVLAPGGVYIKDGGLTLHEALTKVGGVGREAKIKDIKIYRLKPNSKDRETISVNYEAIRKSGGKDILLEPYDMVEVGRSKDSMAMAILKFALGAGKSAVTSGATNAGYRIVY